MMARKKPVERETLLELVLTSPSPAPQPSGLSKSPVILDKVTVACVHFGNHLGLLRLPQSTRSPERTRQPSQYQHRTLITPALYPRELHRSNRSRLPPR